MNISIRVISCALLASTLLLATALLSSCGGDNGGIGSGGTGVTGNTVSGVQLGTVSGFGSIIVEGNKYDDSAASITTETEPGNVLTASSTAIKLGMQVKASFDSTEKLKTMVPAPAVVGLVSAVSGNIVSIAGQTISVQTSSTSTSALTIFEGLSGLADIGIGDRLEVYGQRDSSDLVIATRIEQLDNASNVVRVTGPVSAYTESANPSFKVGSLTVLTDSSTKRLPVATLIKNGDIVSAWSSAGTNAGTSAGTSASGASLLAKVIRVDDANADASAPWRVGGPIRDIDSNAKTIRVAQVLIDFSSATFSGGTANDMKAGTLVRVKGTATATATSARILKATAVELLKTPAAVKIELTGVISDFSSASSFKVRGAIVNASPNTVQFSNGSSSNLADGVLIAIEGIVVNGIIEPAKVEFKTTEDDRSKAFVGTISNYNGATGDFAITGTAGAGASVAARLTSATAYKFFNGGPANITNFAAIASTSNGPAIQVSGGFVKGVFIVDEVRLGSVNIKEVKFEGVVYQVNTTNRTLTVNGIAVTWQATTSINTVANLRNGALIKVEGLASNASGAGVSVMATKIDIKTR